MINLDANGNLTDGGLRFKQIDPAKVPGNSFVTGITETLINNDMHIIILRNDLTMVYHEIDFNAAKTKGSRFFTGVSAKDTWF